ncbi:MAG: glycosyl transferase group 1 [Desulfacinum sp.]|nr:glycosyl transferase group 1 [Desulfacinum sp.]
MRWNYQKILYVVNSLVADGGVERRNLEQVLYLRRQGLDVHVCALRAVGATAERYRSSGVPVHFFRAYRAGEAAKNRVFLQGLSAFYRFLFRERFGVVVGSQAPSHYLARLACLPRLGRRVFAMERVATWDRKPIWKVLDALCSLWTDRILCISPWVRDGLTRKGRVPSCKVLVLEEGYRKDPAEPFCLPPFVGSGSKVIGCVGALQPEKGQALLLKAFREVAVSRRNVFLVLAGSGPEEPHLRRLARELGISEKVIFLGHVSQPHALYPRFDVFVFPSTSEGLGGVWVEACLHGLPVVAADVRPVRDYVVHGRSGLLYRPGDWSDLARCILSLLDDPEKCQELGRNALAMARRFFDFETQMSKLHALLCPDHMNSPRALACEDRPS